jgi:hypothetical protein
MTGEQINRALGLAERFVAACERLSKCVACSTCGGNGWVYGQYADAAHAGTLPPAVICPTCKGMR